MRPGPVSAVSGWNVRSALKDGERTLGNAQAFARGARRQI